MHDKSFTLRMNGTKSALPLAFFIIIFCVALFTGGRLPYVVLYMYGFSIFFSFLLACIVINILYTNISSDKSNAVTGEIIKISTDIENTSFLPIPYIAINTEIFSNVFWDRKSLNYITLGPRSEATFEEQIKCEHYGFYSMDSIKVSIQDVFGIFTISKHIKSDFTIRVYPKWYDLSSIPFSSYQQTGDALKKYHMTEDFADIGGIRQYRDGDNVKRVHWKLSAKRDELLVKDFEFSSNAQICVIMDTYKGDYANGNDAAMLSEKVAECAASIIYYCLNKGMHTGLMYQEGEHVAIWADNTQAFPAFLDSIIMTKMDGEIPLSDLMLKDVSGILWGSTILILTPFLSNATLLTMVTLKNMGYDVRCVYFGDKEKDEQENAVAYLRECGVQVTGFYTTPNASSALLAK